jgi:basic membrane protein A
MLPAMLWAGPAIVYTGSVYDDTYSYSVHRGIQIFQGKSGKKIHEVESAPDGSKYVDDVLRCIEQGYSPIVFPYSGQFPEIMDLAWTYEKTDFIFLDHDDDMELPNTWFFSFADHEGAFLAGALAALMTQTKTVGFVYVDGYPVLLRFRAGFIQGVHAVNPDIRIVYGVLEDRPGVWRDAEQGGETAAELMAQGADILFAAAGFAGTGVLAQAAKQDGVYAIGVDINQNDLYPGTMIGSMVKRSDRAVNIALSLVSSGIHRNNIKRLGLAQDAVGIDFEGVEKTLVPDAVRKELEKMKSEILLGKRRVKSSD